MNEKGQIIYILKYWVCKFCVLWIQIINIKCIEMKWWSAYPSLYNSHANITMPFKENIALNLPAICSSVNFTSFCKRIKPMENISYKLQGNYALVCCVRPIFGALLIQMYFTYKNKINFVTYKF